MFLYFGMCSLLNHLGTENVSCMMEWNRKEQIQFYDLQRKTKSLDSIRFSTYSTIKVFQSHLGRFSQSHLICFHWERKKKETITETTDSVKLAAMIAMCPMLQLQSSNECGNKMPQNFGGQQMWQSGTNYVLCIYYVSFFLFWQGSKISIGEFYSTCIESITWNS